MSVKNPFSFEAATSLRDEEVVEWYVKDHNLSRAILSKRNILVIGNRGSGKTMMLKYYEIVTQRNAIERTNKESEGKRDDGECEYFGVYIPCNDGLLLKRESSLYEDINSKAISRHILTLYLLYYFSKALSRVEDANPHVLSDEEERSIRTTVGLSLGCNISDENRVFKSISDITRNILIDDQVTLNNPNEEPPFKRYHAFETLIYPFLAELKDKEAFKDYHIMLMFDDVQYLDKYQMRTLNSWISIRSHDYFSFKTTITRKKDYELFTLSDGAIMEGHDYSAILLEYSMHYPTSDFGKLARDVVKKRLELINSGSSPESFFPMNPRLEVELKECEKRVKFEYLSEHPKASRKQVNDHVYKYAPAIYFRDRYERSRGKAGRPPYSGFDILTYLSTGVIRNLLEPCFKMYDKVLDEHESKNGMRLIRHGIQTRVIQEISKEKWQVLREGISHLVPGCAKAEDKQILNLFDQLAILFRKRLLDPNASEPRANSFAITEGGLSEEEREHLFKLLDFAQQAQFLYVRLGTAKDYGGLEEYYVPNRMLWPARGLDPHGQHARIYLSDRVLLAATIGQKIPYDPKDEVAQEVLFDG